MSGSERQDRRTEQDDGDGPQCFACGSPVDVQEEEWWSHRWEERPSKENVEKKIDEPDFRDWFVENYVFCEDCHKELMHTINGMREGSGVTA